MYLGYEGHYQVSNFGTVISLKCGKIKTLSLSKNEKGYCQCVFYKNKKAKTVRVHRLVAQAFIANPNNYPQVNHINGIKTDNTVDNLEWCDNSMNQLHAFSNGLQKSVSGNNNPKARKVNQYSLDGTFIKCWNSFYDIKNHLGYSYSSLWRCCIGKYKKSHNFIWKYAE